MTEKFRGLCRDMAFWSGDKTLRVTKMLFAMSSRKVFQTRCPATVKDRLPTVESLTAVTSRRLVPGLYDGSVQAFEVYYWGFGSCCVRGVVVGGVDVTLHCTWRASPWRTPILQCWVGFKQSLNYSPNSAQDYTGLKVYHCISCDVHYFAHQVVYN